LRRSEATAAIQFSFSLDRHASKDARDDEVLFHRMPYNVLSQAAACIYSPHVKAGDKIKNIVFQKTMEQRKLLKITNTI
jgi:hypothetical protein